MVSGLSSLPSEDETTEGEPEPERPDREGADGDDLAPHGHLLPAADGLLLGLGELFAATLLAAGSPGLETEVEVVEDLGAFGHAPSV